MLYIVCRDSHLYKDTLNVICEKLSFYDYEIIDPKSHETKRSFSYLLIANDNSEDYNASKIWRLKKPPSKDMTVDEKKAVFATIKEIVEFVRNNTLKKEILNVDIPRFADLQEFLSGFKGQVMELKLQDGRVIGIYPDGDKLSGKYSGEYHVSTVLNLSKLLDIFGYIKLSVKDL